MGHDEALYQQEVSFTSLQMQARVYTELDACHIHSCSAICQIIPFLHCPLCVNNINEE